MIFCLAREKWVIALKGKERKTCIRVRSEGTVVGISVLLIHKFNENQSPPFAYGVKITQSVSTVTPNLCRREEQDNAWTFE